MEGTKGVYVYCWQVEEGNMSARKRSRWDRATSETKEVVFTYNYNNKHGLADKRGEQKQLRTENKHLHKQTNKQTNDNNKRDMMGMIGIGGHVPHACPSRC